MNRRTVDMLAECRAADQGAVLAKAFTRSGALLGLKRASMAHVIGVSPRTASRLLGGDRPMHSDSKEAELAILLVRVCRALDSLVGNDDAKRVAWMDAPNAALGGVPRDLIQTVYGLVATLNYLEGVCSPS